MHLSLGISEPSLRHRSLPVIFSSLEYLTRKLRGSLYVMLNLALAKLVAHVAVLAANIYALCAALAFVRANELWNLEVRASAKHLITEEMLCGIEA